VPGRHVTDHQMRLFMQFRQSDSVAPRIARRGIESSEHLGRHRWIVERTLAWLARFRRLTIRYERRVDLHLAFTTLACVLICRA
jgi:transposase